MATADTTNPTVTAFSPADEATGVAVSSNIVWTFSEDIAKGTGTIVLKTAAGTVVATYDAASSTNLSISGSTLTINPTADLSYSTSYKVEMADGAIKDLAGNNYAGTTSYNFTTVAETRYGGSSDDTLVGSVYDDVLFGGDGNDSLEGDIGNDTLNAGNGLDTLRGGAGDDALSSRTTSMTAGSNDGANVMDGGLGNDTLAGGNGNDTLLGAEGNDSLTGSDGNDSIEGGAGIDTLFGGAGNDSLSGGDGNDKLYDQTSGTDTLVGGAGDDYLSTYTSTEGDSLEGGQGNDSLYGGTGNDTMVGGDGNDSLSGSDANDSGDGGTGDDTLSGGAGNDYLLGGDGNDKLYDQTSGTDTLVGGAGDDYLSTYTSTEGDSLEGSLGNDSLFGGTGNDTLMGGDGNDYLSGSDGSNNLYGEEGNDSVYGGTGDDSIEGGLGNDDLEGDLGNDTIEGGAGDDTIDGEPGNDSVLGGDGNDSLVGGEGNDSLNGGAGLDTLFGGSGNDSLSGGDGNDNLYDQTAGVDSLLGGAGDDYLSTYTSTGADSLDGGLGNDSLIGGTGNDTLNAGDGNDYLSGNENNDSLEAGIGNDTLHGGLGNDTLVGGLGDDSLLGGEGDDTYYIDSTKDFIYESGGNDTAYVSTSFVKLPSSIETVTYTNNALALPYWISALLPDDAAGLNYQTMLGDAKTFAYIFPATLPSYDTSSDDANGYTAFTAAQQARTLVALQYISSLLDLQFIQATDAAAVNTFSFASNTQTNSSGYAQNPLESYGGSDVFLDIADYNTTLADGTYGALTLIHEVGHALGLKHPFLHEQAGEGGVAEPPYLTGTEESTTWTVMSYDDTSAQWHLQYSPLDIAALQYLYGPSNTSRTGNDTYTVSSSATNLIWDGAGVDVIDAASVGQAVTIYLTPGYWGYVGTAQASTITSAGQVTVNFGTTIENLIGSAFNDHLYGNEVANSIQGGLGNDTLSGGEGIDTAVFSQSKSKYTLTSTAAGWVVAGPDGSDTLTDIEFAQFADQTWALKNSLPSGSVSFSGSVSLGSTLTASNTLADADGIAQSGASAITYAWSANGTLIPSATGATLTVTAPLVGKLITVAASYVDAGGTTETVSSAASYLKTSYDLAQPKLWFSSQSILSASGTVYTQDNPLLVIQTAQVDLNNDGLEDLFTYDSYPLDIPTPNPPPSVFLNTGDSLKKAVWTGPTLRDPHGTKILVGDFNGDNLPDLFSLVAVDPANGAFPDLKDFNNLLFNSATGFNQVKEFDDKLGFWYAGASGDIDNDGDLDVVMFNFHVASNGVKNQILWNDGAGNFTYDSTGMGDISIVDQAEFRDVNRDGYLDLVIDHIDTQSTRTPTVSVMWGNGLGYSLANATQFNLGSDAYLCNICFADLNADNLDEIILSGDNAAGQYWIKVFRSDDNAVSYLDATSQYIDRSSTSIRFDHIRVTDIDGDGLLDIFSPDKSDAVRWEWNGLKFIKQNTPAKGTVNWSGSVAQGETLTATNALTDLDGLGTISYQWRAGDASISGATSSTYVLTQAEVGKLITVAASFTDDQGSVETVLSAASSAVAGLSGNTTAIQAYIWKSHTLLNGVTLTAGTYSGTSDSLGAANFTAVTETSLSLTASRAIPAAETAATTAAVNLQDAIAILKMIVGLPVNGTSNGVTNALSPYQALAADFNADGEVGLQDAIGVLKLVVGLTAPQPSWHFLNELDTSVAAKANLKPGTAQTSITADLSGTSPVHVGLVAYLSGYVDGSYAGATGASDLDMTEPNYFVTLVANHPGVLSAAQFGN